MTETPVDQRLAEVRARLVRAVSRICPAWLAGQAEDIVQTALIRVAGLLQQGEGNHVLGSSYLWKVAYTATIDEIRRQRRRHEVSLDDGADGPALTPAVDPERARSSDEIGEALTSCLGALAEPRRLAVTLHLLGHSVPEAGRILGWESKRVENLVYRGLADLRRCLEGKGVRP